MGRQRQLRFGTVTALFAGLAAVAAPAPAAVDFAPPSIVRIGASANGIAAGDLNRDGVDDLVVANGVDGIVIAFGAGGGRFTAGPTVATGREPVGVAVADLDGDADLDVASAESGAGTVTVIEGDGAGGLVVRGRIPVGEAPTTLSAGDVDRDGDVDLATANLTSNNASLLVGDGRLGFTSVFVNVGAIALDAEIADGTGDGVADLVVANGALRILPGPWSGTAFATPFEVATPTFPTKFAAGDLNRDGLPDIVGTNTFANTVSVFLGRGGNAFRRLTAAHVSNLPSALAVADVNADGIQDVATVNTASGDVSVLEGKGDGTFRQSRQFRVGRTPIGLAARDLTGDGRSDLLVTNLTGTVSVLIARPLTPGTRGTATVRRPCTTPRKVVAAESIGCVAVGMSQAQVREILGPPSRVRRAGRDYAFQYPKLLVGFLGDSNQVDLIASERPGVGLANGLRIGTSGSLITRRMPAARCRTRNGVRFCQVVRGERFTGFVDKGGVITEIDVGFVD